MRKKKGQESVVSIATGYKEYDAATEKDKNIVGKRIAEARKKKGLSIAAFGKLLGQYGVQLTTGAVGKWETGDSVPNAYQLIAICLALDIEDQIPFFISDYMPALNKEGEKKVREYKEDLIASGKYKPAPKITSIIQWIERKIYDMPVSAGTGNFLDNGSYEMVSFPASTVPDGADFGVRVTGDSMEPVYHDGQIVWVKECEQLNVGEVGIFIYDGDGYLKVYGEREPDEGATDDYTDSYGVVHMQPTLISINTNYPERVVSPGTTFKIVGRVL